MIGGHGDGLGNLRWAVLQAKVVGLESTLARAPEKSPAMRALAAEKIEQGVALSQKEVAAFLNTTVRQILRLETRGRIRRCPALDGLVRYAPRDVLKLASAPGREA